MQLNKCSSCGVNFEVVPADLAFLETVSPRLNGKRFLIPQPHKCPACRLQARVAYRNEHYYHSRPCDLCRKNVVTVYSPSNSHPVFCYQCFWGDAWDATSYSQPYDPSRSFLEQFHNLQMRTPQIAMINDNGVTSENCEYCQDFAEGKNCYMCVGSGQSQDCLFSTHIMHCKEAVDCYFTTGNCELIYECLQSQGLYHCTYLSHCSGCSSCHFGFDLRGCADCFCCVGLRRQRFCAFNQQYSESEYQQLIGSYFQGSYQELQRIRSQFSRFLASFPKRAVYQTNCENSIGDALVNCKDAEGFGSIYCQKAKNLWFGCYLANSQDVTVTLNPEWCYDGLTPDNSYMTCFTTWCWRCKHVFYSDNCHWCESLFGCVSMKRKQFAILNQVYSESEYTTLVPQIIENMRSRGEWGAFFPLAYSPFPYNQTKAQELFPLSKQQVLEQGLRWHESEASSTLAQGGTLPDLVSDFTDSMAQQLYTCEQCNRAYRIIKQELLFYRKMKIPVPRVCCHCRRNNRYEREPCFGHLYQRDCCICNQQVASTYPPTQADNVLCEKCYLDSVG